MDYYNNYYEGFVWVPGNENSKTIVTLFIDDNGNVIISSLQPLKDNDVNEKWSEIKVLYGYINGHNISKDYSIKMYDVIQIHHFMGVITKFKYQSSNSLISPTFDDEISNSLYNSIRLNSNIISQWIPITGFNFEFENNEDTTFKVSHLYQQPKQIKLFKNDNYCINLFFRASSGSQRRRNSYIKEEVFLNIETQKLFELDELFKIKTIIERLFNIILFTPFYSTIVEFKSSTGTIYQEIAKSKELSTSQSNSLKFEIFRDNSQEIFEKWFEKQDGLDLFIKNFFSVYGQKGVLIENKFLTYVSVLENYHKNKIKKDVFLKDRLSFILQNSSINAKIKNIDNYAEKLKVTRNYHAHLEEKHEKNALNVDGITKFNRLLEVIIHEIMLREVGVAEFIIPNWLDNLISEINESLN